MKYTDTTFGRDLDAVPQVPYWITSSRCETLADAAFLSGGALATLHLVGGRRDVPHALLRARLALYAAESCVVYSGRSERAGALRDEVHLLRPGDEPGPAGKIYQAWQRAVAQPISIKTLHRALPAHDTGRIAVWLDESMGRGLGQGGPIEGAARLLEGVLTDVPHAEEVALILADAALAQAMGWKHLMPLLAAHLSAGDLLQTGDALRLACHCALVTSASSAVQMAGDLARKRTRLEAVVPKLRAKKAEQAVDLFLSRDAVSPSIALSGFMSDRAARRLCTRLVELGVVRELTGRDCFRLYGV
jgi:hypothetical protein